MVITVLTWLEFGISPLILILLLLITAPYGRHNRKGFGPQVGNRLAWFLMELPAPLIPAVYFALCVNRHGFQWFPFSAFLIWESHYIYRTFIYSWTLRGAKRNFPLSLVAGAFFFNIMNGLINSNAAYLSIPEQGPHTLSFHHIAGAVIFLAGFILTTSSDTIIRNLRTKGDKSYYIPRKGLFNYISNPHYLGEILEWTGWAIFLWHPSGVAFAIFTFANLFPRAISNHKWYKTTFPEYPQKRKIILPFVL